MTDDDLSEKIATAWARLRASQPAVEAGAPWPLAERFDDAPEASWGPPEVLGHLAEMVAFWTGEFERVAKGSPDGSPVPFGRTAADAARMAGIEHDRHLAPADLFAHLETALDRLSAVSAAWSAEERGHTGVHPRLGLMTIPEGIDRFIASHLADHAAQLEAALGSPPTGS